MVRLDRPQSPASQSSNRGFLSSLRRFFTNARGARGARGGLSAPVVSPPQPPPEPVAEPFTESEPATSTPPAGSSVPPLTPTPDPEMGTDQMDAVAVPSNSTSTDATDTAVPTPSASAPQYRWKATSQYGTAKDAFAIIANVDGVKITGHPALRTPEAAIPLYQVEDSGDPFAQKDLARLIGPDEIAIAVCGYYPTLKAKEIPHKRNIGHAGLAVGVENNGQRGVLTINNPQTYIGGSFQAQDRGYGSFFMQKLQFPPEITASEKAAYEKNIITMTALANTYIPFASNNFNGEDPLGIYNQEKIREAGNNLILAVYGDQQARQWLKEGRNTAYCAELVSAGINTGATTLLTKAYIEELRQWLMGQNGEDLYPNLYEKVSDRVNNRTFLSENGNSNLKYANIGMVDDNIDLKPLNERCPNADQSGTGLAFRYYEFSDIAYGSLHDTYPRKETAGLTGTELQAAQNHNQKVGQKQIQEFMKMVAKFKSIANLDGPTAAAFEAYVAQMVTALAKVYPSESERDAALKPLVEKGRQFTPTGPNGEGMFIPPDLYLLPTTGWADTETLGVCFFSDNLEKIA